MKGNLGFFNTHPFLVTFVMGIVLAMERSKQNVNSIKVLKLPSVRHWVASEMRCSG